ncbi:YebC/PmpR family DNA-binding transcriptional regulator [Candidatus Profftella armatura (Diaphorina cf. continua)]|uniref:Probable transcriptional regulatory protein PADco_0080 n=1 Tax=Candidatus Profftella armatura (Diaphorina cf. continua) TaxID=2661583 RepID=A0A7R7ABK7_9PROT|nr:YebC/PmpR family DNA-binding transcriptional regulator [Candidatus Profftella armatura (Diaphorina cf. continua)]BCG49428.1 YebC/PmpR family DNA-binding transcriptional regulator [Candidatus Profftella armatura (Diaphorina cf. continua)]
MAGHSKWANIKRKKLIVDAKRSKIWTRIMRELRVAINFGNNPDTNIKLRLAIEKALNANIPKNNILRAMQKNNSNTTNKNYTEVRYEGYGINGSAIIIDCITNNRMRTVSEIRNIFNKNGGNLSKEGSVSFMFKHCGQLLFSPNEKKFALLDLALEKGAEDVLIDKDDKIIIITPPSKFIEIKNSLEILGFKSEFSGILMKPHTNIVFKDDEAIKFKKFLNELKKLHDVKKIYTNAVTLDL